MADVEKLLSAGDRAFVDEDFGEAVKCYTQVGFHPQQYAN